MERWRGELLKFAGKIGKPGKRPSFRFSPHQKRLTTYLKGSCRRTVPTCRPCDPGRSFPSRREVRIFRLHDRRWHEWNGASAAFHQPVSAAGRPEGLDPTFSQTLLTRAGAEINSALSAT